MQDSTADFLIETSRKKIGKPNTWRVIEKL